MSVWERSPPSRLNPAKIILENIVASNVIPLDKHALKRLILTNFPFSE